MCASSPDSPTCTTSENPIDGSAATPARAMRPRSSSCASVTAPAAPHPPSPCRSASSADIASAKRTGGACCAPSSARAAATSSGRWTPATKLSLAPIRTRRLPRATDSRWRPGPMTVCRGAPAWAAASPLEAASAAHTVSIVRARRVSLRRARPHRRMMSSFARIVLLGIAQRSPAPRGHAMGARGAAQSGRSMLVRLEFYASPNRPVARMDLRDELEAALGELYSIETELGGGGMSRVFLAEETALGRRVVVKVLPRELTGGVNVDRFRREIMLAAQLQHPHIVTLLSTGQVAGVPYFTMPYEEGRSLRAELRDKGPLPIGEVVGLLGDVAKALTFAHERGVIHRDIKPDNILVCGGAAVVSDFGIAKAVSD